MGKTERELHECCIEHSCCYKSSPVQEHIDECENIKQIKNLMPLNTSLDAVITTTDHRDTNINIVKNNVRITDSHKNWNVL